MKILSVGVVSKSVTIVDISEQVFCVGAVSKCIEIINIQGGKMSEDTHN